MDRGCEANAIQLIDTTMGVALKDHLERVLAERFVNFRDLLSFQSFKFIGYNHRASLVHSGAGRGALKKWRGDFHFVRNLG